MRGVEPPAGFTEFSIGTTRVVCAAHIADAVREALGQGTLYDFAARCPGAHHFAGRGPVYAVSLPGSNERMVIRRNRHGGLFGSVTGDVFAAPTRAPHELYASERLRMAGVPCVNILGYAAYFVAPGLRRADVISRQVQDSADLSSWLIDDSDHRRDQALRATAILVRALSGCGARHQDLNIKNVLLHHVRGTLQALVLDVDRVTFGVDPSAALELNLARILRSARNWQSRYGARVSDAELAGFADAARTAAPL